MSKEVQSISFWKRNINSIESVDRILIKSKDGCTLVQHNQNNAVLAEDIFRKISDTLLTEYKDAFTSPYLCYLYEEDIHDYSVKFFLTVKFADATYLCIKGTQPFKQKHYQDILKLFQPFFKEI